VAITITVLADHLRLPASRIPAEQSELLRVLLAAVGIVESWCGRIDSDPSSGRASALDEATLVIGQHLWETRPGRNARPGLSPGSGPPSKEDIPQLAYGLLLPHMKAPMG